MDNVLFSPFIALPDSAPVGFPRLHIGGQAAPASYGGQASHDHSWAGFIGIVDEAAEVFLALNSSPSP